MEPKHVALLRHAKSSWDDPSLADHDRPLNARGRRAASRVGRYLRQTGVQPDLVLCSSAVRTRQTLELLALDTPPDVLVDSELYGAAAAELLARLRQIAKDVASVLVVGHNPGIHELAISLTDERERLATFPTAALADLLASVPTWKDLRPGVATLRAFVTPRELDGGGQ